MEIRNIIWSTFLGGAVYFVISSITGVISNLIAPVEWTNIPGVREISDPIMTAFFLYGFVIAFGATLIYRHFNLRGTIVYKGYFFGALMWIAVSLPTGFIVFTTMNYPTGFYLNSIAFGLINWIIVGIVIAWANEKK